MSHISLAAIGYLHGHGHPLPRYRGLSPEGEAPAWPGPEPDHYESACDLVRFYALYPTATCSLRTARALAGIIRDHAPRTA